MAECVRPLNNLGKYGAVGAKAIAQATETLFHYTSVLYGHPTPFTLHFPTIAEEAVWVEKSKSTIKCYCSNHGLPRESLWR